ncbi:hypothetical protein FBZ82_101164 [Azospirillum brasilense]|uniref:Uncharacterized protein n=1 Tax=Azospirillum brasilense TaxID=192 RepID=A0A560BNP9_AZOBR|nr:hypothetical protein [Azospirillum brasilense]TWA74149.1 hypothetical protein FBZ82_101164 [Azospirillum brasilense]
MTPRTAEILSAAANAKNIGVCGHDGMAVITDLVEASHTATATPAQRLTFAWLRECAANTNTPFPRPRVG